jgi:hypothetical protein
MTVPTGLTVSGSTITTAGTLAVALQTGYSIPTTASQTNWDTAFSWGNHASAGYLTSQPWVVSGSNIYYNTGNVGVGTASPAYKLDVNGITRVTKLNAGDSITTSNSTRALNLISTDAVMRILRISSNSLTASPSMEFMHRTTADGSNTVYWDFYASTNGFFIRNRGGGDVNVLTASASNNVLIGTTTDGGFKLDVNGTIRSNNVITASGGNSTNWNTAFGWGDHSTQGYLTGTTGFTGVFSVPTNPPGQQNLDIVDGIIVNVF